MPLPWASDHALDAAKAAALVARAFPDLAPATAEYADEGWDSVAFVVNEEWIFRFPKRAEVEAFHDVECALLPRLAARLPLPVPRPTRRGPATDAWPFRFMGYQRLAGTPGILLGLDAIDREACAAQVGAFLSVLHAFPADEAVAVGAPRGPLDGNVEAWRARALDWLPAMRRALPDDLARRALAFLEGPLPASSARHVVLVHNDLCDGHFLVDATTGRLSGVIDWGDLAVGDAAMDFAGLWQWMGRPLVEQALRAYSGPDVGPDDLARAWAASLFMGFSTLYYGVETSRTSYVASALRSLGRDLPE